MPDARRRETVRAASGARPHREMHPVLSYLRPAADGHAPLPVRGRIPDRRAARGSASLTDD